VNAFGGITRLALFPNVAGVQGRDACQLVWCDCRSAESPALNAEFDVSYATGSYPPWSCYLTSCQIKWISWSRRHTFKESQYLL